MATLPWLRLYTETLSDRKIKLVGIETGYPKPLIIGVWTSLLMLAGESPDRGKLLTAAHKPLPFEFMADEIGLAGDELHAILDAFIEVGMVAFEDGAYIICKWDERQFKSDNSYERVKKFRQKQKARERDNADEVGNGYTKRFDNGEGNVSRNVSVTDQNTESDTEYTPKGGEKTSPTPPEKLKDDDRRKTPKWQLMYQFLDSSKIPFPGKKSDQKFWWSNITEIYNMAEQDASFGARLIRDSIKKMREERLTIGGPQSIVNVCRDLVAHRNGAGPPSTNLTADQKRALAQKMSEDP